MDIIHTHTHTHTYTHTTHRKRTNCFSSSENKSAIYNSKLKP